AAGGPALLFTRVGTSPFPVVTNLFGTAKRVEIAFGRKPRDLIARAASLPERIFPPTPKRLWGERSLFGALSKVGLNLSSNGPVLEMRQNDLSQLPVLTTWPEDGGPFITLPLVYTEHPEGHGHNLGIYRMQVYEGTRAGMHWQIAKGGGFHYAVAEAQDRSLPVNVFLGGPPALMVAAIAPLPENVPELLLASLLLGRKLPMAKNPAGVLPLMADAEFVLVGEVPPKERAPEGPFGDHYGYYSLTHDYPVFHCKALFHKRDAIYPATVVGKPRQEDFFLGDFLQELLSPIFPRVMPAVTDLWAYGETGYHSLAAAVVKQRFKREAMVSAFRILGEGQLALTKFLLVLDRPMDLKDFPAVLEHVLARADFRTDLYLFANLSMDTLDYTGPKVNEGSKGVLLGVGDPIRELPREFRGELPHGFMDPRTFCGGCLVLNGPDAKQEPEAGQRLAHSSALKDWPLVVLVDDAERTTRSVINFLWTTFTRFEPAADVYAAKVTLVRQQPSFTPPIVIDARLKPGFPKELFCDPDTSAKVTTRWREYFPEGMEMGD
ncbi:MAG TPA: UbiD family decarboxylase, partial [Candidatus Eisenbacteria bacterium]|nr:UbiD family decarboxylase [Candidatus Eisenbacteria bacterium]